MVGTEIYKSKFPAKAKTTMCQIRPQTTMSDSASRLQISESENRPLPISAKSKSDSDRKGSQGEGRTLGVTGGHTGSTAQTRLIARLR